MCVCKGLECNAEVPLWKPVSLTKQFPFARPDRAQPRSLSRQSDPESIQALLFDILVKLDYNYVYQSPPFFCR